VSLPRGKAIFNLCQKSRFLIAHLAKPSFAHNKQSFIGANSNKTLFIVRAANRKLFDHLLFLFCNMSKLKEINKWTTFFKNRGLSDDISDKYITYITKLLENNAPIIFDFNHLSLLLGRQQFYLASVVNAPYNHYRNFKIKKRSGGLREITTPYPALLEMQYWILNNILTRISILCTWFCL
jgi:hypothetical protein